MNVNSKLHFRPFLILLTITLSLPALAEITSRQRNGFSSLGTIDVDDTYRSQVRQPPDFNQLCFSDEGFIKKDGSLGTFGEQMKKEILGKGNATNRTAQFFGDGRNIKGLDKYCPKFKSLSNEEKLDFWIWTMTLISNFEGGCSPKAPSNPAAPNGQTCGAFQTPKSECGKTPEWRGPGCKEGPGYESMEHQAGCAAEILGASLEGDYHKGQPSFVTESGSHWGVVMEDAPQDNPKHNENYFMSYPPCGYHSSKKYQE